MEIARIKNHELKQIRGLKFEIEQEMRRLKELEAIATATTSATSNIPEQNKTDKVGKYAVEIAMLREKIEENIEVRCRMCNRLFEFINGIEDPIAREAIKLHYIECKSWVSVAFAIGGNNTADSVRMIATRAIKKKNGIGENINK